MTDILTPHEKHGIIRSVKMDYLDKQVIHLLEYDDGAFQEAIEKFEEHGDIYQTLVDVLDIFHDDRERVIKKEIRFEESIKKEEHSKGHGKDDVITLVMVK